MTHALDERVHARVRREKTRILTDAAALLEPAFRAYLDLHPRWNERSRQARTVARVCEILREYYQRTGRESRTTAHNFKYWEGHVWKRLKECGCEQFAALEARYSALASHASIAESYHTLFEGAYKGSDDSGAQIYGRYIEEIPALVCNDPTIDVGTKPRDFWIAVAKRLTGEQSRRGRTPNYLELPSGDATRSSRQQARRSGSPDATADGAKKPRDVFEEPQAVAEVFLSIVAAFEIFVQAHEPISLTTDAEDATLP